MSVPEISEVPEVPQFNESQIADVTVEDELVEAKVDVSDPLTEQEISDISQDFDYRQLPEELESEQKDIFDQMRDFKGSVEDKINFLKGKYDEAYAYIDNIYSQIKNTKLFKFGGAVVTISSLLDFVKKVQDTVKKGEQIKDMGEKFEDWYKQQEGDKPEEPKEPPKVNESQLSFEEMVGLIKVFNNREDTVNFLARHKQEYDSFTQEQKNQILSLAKQNF